LVEAVLEEAGSEKPKAKRAKKVTTEEIEPSLFPDEQE
jgi:hypothetical protein